MERKGKQSTSRNFVASPIDFEKCFTTGNVGHAMLSFDIIRARAKSKQILEEFKTVEPPYSIFHTFESVALGDVAIHYKEKKIFYASISETQCLYFKRGINFTW